MFNPDELMDGGTNAEPTELDIALCNAFARVIGEYAFLFNYYPFQAWALTSFEAWTELAGQGPVLAFESDFKPRDHGSIERKMSSQLLEMFDKHLDEVRTEPEEG